MRDRNPVRTWRLTRLPLEATSVQLEENVNNRRVKSIVGGGSRSRVETHISETMNKREDRRRREDLIRDLQMKPRLTREEEEKLRRYEEVLHDI